MRIVVIGLCCFVLCLGVVACRTDVGPRPGESAAKEDPWRRTVDGWEKGVCPTVAAPSFAVPHPAWLAVAQILFSVTALMALERTASNLPVMNRIARSF